MSTDFHTIILGLGAMGTAAAAQIQRRLAARGRGERVLGLEQYDIPHAMGSSHGQSRLIRLAYYEHPDYVPLLRRAYELWRELEAASGVRLLQVTGGLYMGRPENELLVGSLASAQAHGLAHEILSEADLRRRFPQFRLPAGHAAFFEADAGFLLPEKAVAAQAAQALRHGAELHTHEPALDWSAAKDGVSVRTAHHVYRAQNLVITAGAWAGRLLPFLEKNLRVTRQAMLWFWPEDPDAFLPGRFPCWCAAVEPGEPGASGGGGGWGLVYGPPMLPDEAGPLGLKISHHFPGEETAPETVARTPLPGDADVVRAMLARVLPGVGGRLLGHRVCLYTNSPDHHFLIDHHPHHRHVLLAAGFSGHGFKFAPVVGEILADLALEGSTALPMAFLRLARLKKSRED